MSKTIQEKAEWYDALTETLRRGFSLDKNSAGDLITATNELLRAPGGRQADLRSPEFFQPEEY